MSLNSETDACGPCGANTIRTLAEAVQANEELTPDDYLQTMVRLGNMAAKQLAMCEDCVAVRQMAGITDAAQSEPREIASQSSEQSETVGRNPEAEQINGDGDEKLTVIDDMIIDMLRSRGDKGVTMQELEVALRDLFPPGYSATSRGMYRSHALRRIMGDPSYAGRVVVTEEKSHKRYTLLDKPQSANGSSPRAESTPAALPDKPEPANAQFPEQDKADDALQADSGESAAEEAGPETFALTNWGMTISYFTDGREPEIRVNGHPFTKDRVMSGVIRALVDHPDGMRIDALFKYLREVDSTIDYGAVSRALLNIQPELARYGHDDKLDTVRTGGNIKDVAYRLIGIASEEEEGASPDPGFLTRPVA